MKKLFLLILLIFIPQIVYGKAAGKCGAVSLKFPLSARSCALAQAGVVLDDISCLYFNPANIKEIDNQQLCLYYQDGVLDSYYAFLGYIHPTEKINYALGISIFDAGKMTIYEFSGDRYKKEAQKDLLFQLGLSKYLIEHNLACGLVIKLLNSTLVETYKATSVSLGAGLLWDLLTTKFGISIDNLGRSLKYHKEFTPLPTTIRLGACIKLLKNIITIYTQVNHVIGEKTIPALGVEYRITDAITLRGGYRFGQTNQGISCGVGIKFYNFEYDLAISPIKDLQSTYRASLSILW